MSRSFPLLFLLTLLGCATAPRSGTLVSDSPAKADPAAVNAIVILVRHAETTEEGRDPALSAAGLARAQLLAQQLQRVDRVLTSPYRRTVTTAAAVAERFGIEAELYDPRDLPALAARLKAVDGITLVVGHSNTTGELVQLLGGDPGTPIDESEYDRIYRVSLPSGSTEQGRYGAPSE